MKKKKQTKKKQEENKQTNKKTKLNLTSPIKLVKFFPVPQALTSER